MEAGLKNTLPLLLIILLTALTSACRKEQREAAPNVNPADSLAFIRSKGVSTLISDSGVLRYKITAESWDIHNNTTPSSWTFLKGLLLIRYNQQKNVDLYVQADTAYLHEQQIWELRGRVHIKNIQGTRFRTEELFWNMNTHEIWSNKFMRIQTPVRELQGTTFRSDEQMTNYIITNSAGAFPVSDTQSNTIPQTDSITQNNTNRRP